MVRLPHRGSTLGLALALCALACPRPVRAAKNEGDLGVEDELQLLSQEENVVVSPARHAQPVDESASAITVITHQEIVDSGYQNLADLMRLVPGADVFRMNPTTIAVGLRGGTTAAGDLVLLRIDGRAANLPGEGLPMWEILPIDVDSIERIEVIRGPASTLYGAGALQGVINVVTRPSSRKAISGGGTVFLAGAQTLTADLHASGTHGKLSWWVSAGHNRRAPADDPFQVALHINRARARIGWSQSKDLQATLEGGVAAGDGVLFADIGVIKANALLPYLLGRLSVGKTRVTVSAEASQFIGRLDAKLSLPSPTGEGDIALARVDNVDFATSSVQIQAQHAFDPFEGNRLTLGLDGWVLHHASDDLVLCPAGVTFAAFDPAACGHLSLDELRGGAYVEDEWRFTKALIGTFGLRFDANSIHPELGISPRAALVAHLGHSQVVRVSFARAFRNPPVIEAYAHFLPAVDPQVPSDIARRVTYMFATQIGNPNVRNARSTSVELGWRGRFTPASLYTTVNLYWARLDDRDGFRLQDVALVPGFGGVYSIPSDAYVGYMNLTGPLITYGGEATVDADPTSWLHLSASYALELSNIARPEPDHRLVGSVRIHLPQGLRLGVDAYWSSTYTTSVTNPVSVLAPRLTQTMGDDLLLDATIAWDMKLGAAGRLEVGAHATNLVGTPFREYPGVDVGSGGSFGAVRLDPRVWIFVRARE